MNREVFSGIPRSLLRWFAENKRNLPWRRSRDSYKIWVSEIMLQQTQVDTVIPYYQRWMKRFPNLGSLASAPLSRVLKAWEGLGYYARARNLHRAARIIAKKREGKFPASAEELRKLPGIGRYTAGAISSIAFNQPEPILDGNVKRVLSRLFALKEAVDTQAGESRLWEMAEDLVTGVKGSYGDFNQALMELGALVCLPENPECGACPVENLCEAHRLKRETEFPVKLRNQKTEALKTVALVAWKDGRVLLEKQPLRSRWGGLWMFPQWVIRNGKNERQLLKDNLRKEFGLEARHLIPRLTVKHGFTKYRIRLRVYESTATVILRSPATLLGGTTKNHVLRSFRRLRRPQDDSAPLIRWLSPSQLDRLPLPAPHQKIAHEIQADA